MIRLDSGHYNCLPILGLRQSLHLNMCCPLGSTLFNSRLCHCVWYTFIMWYKLISAILSTCSVFTEITLKSFVLTVMSLGYCSCVWLFIGFLVIFPFSLISCDPPIQLLCFFVMSINDSTWDKVALWLSFIRATIHMYTWFHLYTRFKIHKKQFNSSYWGIYTVWICRDHIWWDDKVRQWAIWLYAHIRVKVGLTPGYVLSSSKHSV